MDLKLRFQLLLYTLGTTVYSVENRGQEIREPKLPIMGVVEHKNEEN